MPVARRVVRITDVREPRTVAESFAYDTDGAPWELEQAAHDAVIRGATRLVGRRIDTFRQDLADPSRCVCLQRMRGTVGCFRILGLMTVRHSRPFCRDLAAAKGRIDDDDARLRRELAAELAAADGDRIAELAANYRAIYGPAGTPSWDEQGTAEGLAEDLGVAAEFHALAAEKGTRSVH